MSSDVRAVAPTFGFRITSLAVGPHQVHFWDVGGQRSIRTYWRNYFEETDGLVFVIDAGAPHRLQEALKELKELLGQDRLANASVLLLANKQDCPGALSGAYLEEQLQLREILGTNGKTHWRLFPCTAIDETSPHVQEALQWLIADISTRLHYK